MTRIRINGPTGHAAYVIDLRDDPPDARDYGQGWNLSYVFSAHAPDRPKTLKWTNGYAVARGVVCTNPEYMEVLVVTAAGSPFNEAWRDLVTLVDQVRDDIQGTKPKVFKPAPPEPPKPEDPSFVRMLWLVVRGIWNNLRQVGRWILDEFTIRREELHV